MTPGNFDALSQWLSPVAAAAANGLAQSTVLLLAGLAAARFARGRGAAVQSALLRATLVAVVACPAASVLLGALGVPGPRLRLPAAFTTTVVEAVPVTEAPRPAEKTRAADVSTPVTPSMSVGDGEISPRRHNNRDTAEADPFADTMTLSDPSRVEPPTISPARLETPPAVAPPTAPKIATVRVHSLAPLYAAGAGIWLSLSALLLLRLAVAHALLQSARRNARPASFADESECAAAARAVGVPPPPVGVTPRVNSPCLVGWRRPAILLPPAAAPVGRAVFVHELAHLRRGDCAWNLAVRLAAAVLWFQPLAWVLVRRLERAADDVCDDYAVAHGGDRAAYAHALVDLAERLQPCWPALHAGVGVMPFRSAVGQRVARILDSSRSLSTKIGPRAALAVLLLAAGGTLAAGLLRASGEDAAGQGQKPEPAKAAVPATAPAQPVTQPADVVRVRGVVLDPAGKPLAGARVAAVHQMWVEGGRTVPKPPILQTKSGPDGRFDISFPKAPRDLFETTPGNSYPDDAWKNVAVVASADGRGMAWDLWDHVDAAGQVVLKLVPDLAVEGRVVDSEGRPVAGVKVIVNSLFDSATRPYGKPRPAEALRRGVLNYPLLAAGAPATVATDAQGRFRITGLGGERSVDLWFESPTVAVDRAELVTRDMPPVVDEFKLTTYGAKLELAGAPARSVEGTIRDADTGRPLAGVMVSDDDRRAVFPVKAVTDEQGHYRLDGLKKRENAVVVTPGDEQPYLPQRLVVPDAPGLAPVVADVPLHRGVWITGRVTEQASGRPVAARVHYDPFVSNPAAALPEYKRGVNTNRFAVQGITRTRPDGTFRTVGVPGRGIVAVEWVAGDQASAVSEIYVESVGADRIKERGGPFRGFNTFDGMLTPESVLSVKEIDVPKDAAAFPVDLQVVRRDTIEMVIAAEDPAGKPIPGDEAYALGATPANDARGDPATFKALWWTADQTRVVALFAPERKLGKVVALRPADVPAAGDNARRLAVRLQPLAVVTGRALGRDGRPRADANVEGRSRAPGIRADEKHTLDGTQTNPDGRFTLRLPAGAEYAIDVDGGATIDGGNRPLANLTFEAGSAQDLGDIRPMPAEMKAPAKPATQPVAPPTRPAAAAPATAPDGETVRVRGVILDPNGKPAGGVKVVITANRIGGEPDRSVGGMAQTASGADGRFEIAAGPPAREGVADQMVVVAVAEGFGVAWERWGAGASEVTLKLVPDVPVEGRVLDPAGNPVAGVRVTPGGLLPLVAMTVDDELRATRGTPDSALHRPLAGAGGTGFVTTDAAGRFRVAGLGGERTGRLEFRSDQVVVPAVRFVTRAMPPLVRDDDGIKTTTYGATIEVAGQAARPIVGTVRDAKTRQPLAGVRVESKAYKVAAVTDADGRYRLDGVRKWARNRLAVTPGEDVPYLATERDSIPDEPGRGPMTVDVDLYRGVWITGRVTDQVTGKPVAADVLYSPLLSNPNAEKVPDYARMREHVPTRPPQGAGATRADGTFRVVGLPGRGVVAAEATAEPYLKGVGADGIGPRGRLGVANHFQVYAAMGPELVDAVTAVDVPADAPADPVELKLDPGQTIAVHVEDPQGNAARGFDAYGVRPRSSVAARIDAADFKMGALSPDERRALVLFDPARQLGRAQVVRLGYVPDRRLTVRLEPLAVVAGRLVDGAGKPIAAARIDASTAIPSLADGNYSFVAGATTGADGRFTLGLPAGCDYRVFGTRAEAAGQTAFTVLNRFTAEAGETRELGDVVLKPGAAVAELKPIPGGTAAASPVARPVDIIRVRGVVLDPAGRSVAGAAVGANRAGDSPAAPVRTGPDGRFELSFAPPTGKSVAGEVPLVAAAADGFGVAWARWDRPGVNGDVVLKLVEDRAVEGTLLDTEGLPVGGVRVVVGYVTSSVAADNGMAGMAKPAPAGDTLPLPLAVGGGGDGVTTDAAGRFRIAGLGRDRTAGLSFQSPRLSVPDVRVVTRDEPPPPPEPPPGPGRRRVTGQPIYGAKFDVIGTPTRPVMGVVRDAKTRRPLAGVKVEDQALHATAVSDEKGQFRLEGVGKVERNALAATPPADVPYLPADGVEFPNEPGLGPVAVEINLYPGVWVTGRVTDKATGRPVAAKVLYSPSLDNPAAAEIPDYRRMREFGPAEPRQGLGQTRDDGTYRVVGLPGRGVVAAWGRGEPVLKGAGAGRIKERGKRGNDMSAFDVFATMNPTTVDAVVPVEVSPGGGGAPADLQLDPGEAVRIDVTDPQGRPVTGFRAYGSKQFNRVEGPTLRTLAIPPGEARVIVLTHDGRKLGAVVYARPASLPDRRLVAQLEPMATVTGRLVSPGGEPLKNVRLNVGPLFYLEGETAVGSTTVGDDGRFTLPVVPNLDCRLVVVAAGAADDTGNWQPERLRFEPGAVRDMGDVVVKPKDDKGDMMMAPGGKTTTRGS